MYKITDACDNNPEQSYTTKIGKHEPCGFSIVAKSPLTNIREKNICYRNEDWMEKYCKKQKVSWKAKQMFHMW